MEGGGGADHGIFLPTPVEDFSSFFYIFISIFPLRARPKVPFYVYHPHASLPPCFHFQARPLLLLLFSYLTEFPKPYLLACQVSFSAAIPVKDALIAYFNARDRAILFQVNFVSPRVPLCR